MNTRSLFKKRKTHFSLFVISGSHSTKSTQPLKEGLILKNLQYARKKPILTENGC